MADNEEKLVKMLKYVSEHNDFYKNRIKEYGITNPLDITQWPVLTRKELQENRYNMFSDGYKTKYFNQQLRRQSSSGSTGMPVNVYWDYKDWYASNMCLWRKRQEWYGIKPSDKYCMFTLNAFGNTPQEGKLYYVSEPQNILTFNISIMRSEQGYEQVAKKINEFRPDWLYIQPFVMNPLISAYKKSDLEVPKSIRYIESVGEILSSDLRKRALDFFSVPLANMYGSEEMNGIAYECPDHHIHILEGNVFVEVMDSTEINNFGNGKAIITSLTNRAMPLIRYCQDDIISICDKILCCFDERNVINKLDGKFINSFYLEDGSIISEYALREIIAEVNNVLGDIIDRFSYYYIDEMRRLFCNVAVNNDSWKDVVERELVRSYTIKFPYSNIGFEVCFKRLEEFQMQTEKNRILYNGAC